MSQQQPIKRSAPHVVFLIDIVQDYANGHDATARWIQHMILRILLFFLDSIDKRTTWGYRFFSSNTCSIAMSNQSFRSISKTTIQAFLDDFANRIATANNNSNTGGACQPTNEESPFTVVNRNLAQTLAEFHWSDIDLASESPRRQQQWNRAQTMDVKNFTYLITRAPHTLPALREYLPPEMALDDTLSLTDQVTQGLKKMHAVLRKWLWEDYVSNRISLTWIDTASFNNNSNDDEETWICNGISSILRPFGGCHINAAILTEEYARFGLSFGMIFNECTQRKVDTTADTVAPQTADELVSSEYPGPVWTGTLTPHSDDHLPMQVKLYPASSHRIKTDEIIKMEMTRTLYRSQFRFDWLERTSQSIFVLAGDESFLSLLTELETCHRLALVRLVFASSRDEQYAILDPKVTNTAILRLLAPSFELSDVKPAGTLSMYRNRSLDTPPLDYLELPAVPAKKARLSKVLSNIPESEKRRAPLSEHQEALVERIRKKRRIRRERLEAAEESRQQQSQVQVTSPTEIEEEAAVPFPMPGSVGELQTSLRNIYLDALYMNKWFLVDAMKQMYECVEYLLDFQKENVKIREVAMAIRSLAILSSDFDTKHNEFIVGNREQDLPEDERPYFASWRANTMRTVNSDYESRWCKTLKVREGKLQMVIHLLLVSLERREGILSMNHSQKELSGEVDLANPGSEYQLSIYYDRSVVWEQVYDISGFLHDLEHTEAAGPGFRIDPADLSLSTFFTEMHKCLSKAAPDWTQFLVDRSVEEDLPDSQPFGSQITNSQLSSSSFWDPPSPPEGTGNSQKISSQKTSSQSVPGKTKGVMHEPIALTRKKSSSRTIHDLPFMRREVDLSKRKFGTEKTTASTGTKGGPMMKRTSSFTKPAPSSPQKPTHSESQEEDSVRIKIRQPLSPTTPRTRYERDYGFSLAGIGLTPHRNESHPSPHRTEEVLVEDDIEGARTPRRVRRLMMETTPTHLRVDAALPHRRPRRNLTESLLAAASEEPAAAAGRSHKVLAIDPTDDDDDDFDLNGLFNDINPITPFADIMNGDIDGEDIDPF